MLHYYNIFENIFGLWLGYLWHECVPNNLRILSELTTPELFLGAPRRKDLTLTRGSFFSQAFLFLCFCLLNTLSFQNLLYFTELKSDQTWQMTERV